MATEESLETERLEARRRARLFLKFMPRRAFLHKYPVIGRFAASARKRAYLWSFKRRYLRRAFYGGSILALMPLLGLQFPLSLLLALILRANFMVLAALQLITNPFTAAPVYYATHQLGMSVIRLAGYGESIDVVNPATGLLDEGFDVTLAGSEATDPEELGSLASETVASENVHWGRGIATTLNALIVGGVIMGSLVGLLLDMLDRMLVPSHAPPPRRRRSASVSTPSRAPPE